MNFKKIVSLMLACALTISPLNSLAFAENDSTLTAAQVNVALLPLSKVKIESLKERIEKLVEDIEKLGEDIEKLGEDIEKLGEKIEKLYNMSKIMKKVALLWIFLQIFLMWPVLLFRNLSILVFGYLSELLYVFVWVFSIITICRGR